MNPQSSPKNKIAHGWAAILPGAAPLAAGVFTLVALTHLPPALYSPSPQSMELSDRNGVLLREVLDDHDMFSRPVTARDLPRHFVLATLAAEDKRFFYHHGVDPVAVGRAILDALASGRITSGGSTITQQLIKIAGPKRRPRSVGVKLIEALAAMKLDAMWSKDRILESYLNRLDYGNLRLGCTAAARFYFDKPVGDLSVAEAALLASLPRSPSRLNPLRDPAAARQAQRMVLVRMLHNGWLTHHQYICALDERMEPGQRRSVFRAPHFADHALSRIAERTGAVGTTIDLDLNRFIEEKLRSRLSSLKDRRVSNGAAVIIDNRSSQLLALVGSENYFQPGAGQVNAATARRSPGSALKPFTYLLALERGFTPASLLADIPSEFPTPTGAFRPVNFDQSFRGPVRLRSALANSLNVPAVRLLSSIGGPAVLADALTSCGITTLNRESDHYGLGLTIGNAEVRLLELSNAYACLARLGVYRPLHIFLDEGAADSQSQHGKRLFDASAAWLLADILNDGFARAPSFGAQSSLAIGFPVACKTGTSSDFRDNWALGFTPEFTVGVWMGNFDGSRMQRVSGASGAAPLLRDIFRHLRQTRGTSWYPTPSNIRRVQIHPVTGKAMPSSGGVPEYFIAGHTPPTSSPSDVAPGGAICLGDEYAAWIRDVRPPGFALAPDAKNRLAISSPHDGAVYYLDSDLPGSDRLPLKATGSGAISWHSDTLPIESHDGASLARLSIGRHHIVAEDSTTGNKTRLTIDVRGM